jgi:hypothetical protein
LLQPSAGRTGTITNVPAPITPASVEARGDMIDLPGRRFLMGTDYVPDSQRMAKAQPAQLSSPYPSTSHRCDNNSFIDSLLD